MKPARPYRVGQALAAFALTLTLLAPAAIAQNVTQTGTTAGPANAKSDLDPKVKRALSINDYSRWRTIQTPMISADGKWVAYVLRFMNVPTADSKPQLHIYNTQTDKDTVILHATAPQFSPDSRWVVYQVEVPAPPRGGAGNRPAGAGAPPGIATPDSAANDTSAAARARRANEPPPRRAELRELASGKTQHWADVANATFNNTSTHLLLRRRPPTPAGAAGAGSPGGGGAPPGPPAGFGGGAGSAAAGIRGLDALLHDLNAGKSQFLGSVGDAGFNRKGDVLAYTVEATVKDGNGLFAVDLAGGRTYVLDNDARTYSRLTWNDAGTALAVLKAKDVARMREKDNILVAYPNVRGMFAAPDPKSRVAPAKAVTLDTTAAGWMKKFVISDRATLQWSDDNRRVFFGVIAQTNAPDTSRRRSRDSIADVDVWRTQDERIQSLQMIRAEAERNFTFRQAMDVTTGKYIQLTDSSMRDLEIAPDGRWAVGRDARSYISDYGRPRADFYRVNTMTGERTLMLKEQLSNQHVYGISADGKHYLYWKDSLWQDYDLDLATTKSIGTGAPSFVNTEFEYPGPKPSYGIAGFSADGKGVIAQHRFDLWYLPYSGGAARNLTVEGAKSEIVFRPVRPVPPDPMATRAARDQRFIDLTKPITLSAFGEFTKKNGFYELNGSTLKPIVFEDARYTQPTRALNAPQYLLTRQTFAEYPDLRLAGPAFGTSKKISNANPQQAEFFWGRRILFDYNNRDGRRLQGVLALPDDYKDGEKRPMIVTFYERNSQNLHSHTPPSFITGMGSLPVEAVSRGYITMMPDVYFRTGSSHSDMLEAVEAATKKVIELGYADPKKIGVHGHSYGGEGAAFISTQSTMFAAVGMGAGVTDLYSDFAQSWGWSYQVNAGSGQNAFDYYLYGQGRWGFSPWDKPDVYRNESALTHAPRVSQPVLIMHGTADPTVAFQEGLSFYQALRYNKKDAYLLAYPGEGHGLAGLANRKDLTIRYFQFFDHYLRGVTAPKWMSEGVPFLVKDTVREPK